jgi:hypothetical protein
MLIAVSKDVIELKRRTFKDMAGNGAGGGCARLCRMSSTHGRRVQSGLEDVAGNGLGGCCSPHNELSLTQDEGSKCMG